MSSPTQTNAVRFSRSTLWDQQGHFYKEVGVDAWNEKIPYHITNNLTFVNAYANVIFSFFKEYATRYPVDAEPNPFIIVELGAGSGMFGSYLIKQLLELQMHLNRPDLAFRYIMTDFSQKNLDFCRKHPALRKHLDLGILDFAEYDIGKTSTMHLLVSGQSLSHTTYSSAYTKPWIIIANYAFDTVPQDIFRVADGQLLEGLTTKVIPTLDTTTLQPNDPKSLQQIGMDITYHTSDLPYYKEKQFDALLASYKDTLPEESFLFPIAALKAIKNLYQLSGHKMLLLATDKASSHLPPSISAETPDIIFHDASFSMTVNFHALSEYFHVLGGRSQHQPIPEAITTSLFCVGQGLDFFYETEHSFSTFFCENNPFSLFNFYNQLEQFMQMNSPADLLAFLYLTRWDPEVINRCLETIVTCAQSLDAHSLQSFIEGMKRSADYFYYLPSSTSTFVNVGTFFQEIKDFKTALTYYQQSLDYFGGNPSRLANYTFYNMGLCYYYSGERATALKYFQLANQASLTPDMVARGWIYSLTEKVASEQK